ncbi:MAG: DUF3332 domain-containing protein [Calditrichaceae bacterium]|nr:DUF3332 domain-containing protein [Calditrichaceae bacterium]MBN2708881.1 DUF3332 domain-containing protein [Calditrichaceae bacterium]RQV97593.1 MAG: DUF3332 domain-containing protein [Calditrichota bacterium]
MSRRSIVFKSVAILMIVLFSAFTFTGCYGKFELTKRLYKWNGSQGDKFVNSVVMWVLMIIPVYIIVGFVDFVILNVVEFWTGKNPMAMEPGETETQLVEIDGKAYQITATQNRFDVVDMETQLKASLVYNPEEKAWYAVSDNDSHKIAQSDSENFDIIQLIQPDGKIVKVETATGTVVQ